MQSPLEARPAFKCLCAEVQAAIALVAIASGCRASPSPKESRPNVIALTQDRSAARFAGCTVRLDGEEHANVEDCLFMNGGELRVRDALLRRLTPDEDGLLELWSLQFANPKDAPRSIAKSFCAWATRDGRALIVPTFDNGPDYFAEGLVRFVSSAGKIGFANRKLEIVIPATFDWATPFESGRSNVCHGCIAVREPGDVDAHWQVQGGTREVIDLSGHVVAGR